MKKLLLSLAFAALCALAVFAVPAPAGAKSRVPSGMIFVTGNRAEADAKIFVTENRAEADAKIFVTENRAESRRRGVWFFTKNRAEADAKVFFTKNRAEAR